MDAHPEQLSQTVDSPAKRAFMRKLAARGWLGMSWPKAYGGAERPGIFDYVLTEALSRGGAPQPGKGVGIVGKTIIRHGSERMKREFLPRIMRGEIEFAIGYSEPGAGSDAANMQLHATKVARRLAPRRPEDLDHLGALRRLLLARRAHRSRRAEAQGHHAVPDPDGRAGPHHPPDLDDRRRAHERGVLRRRLRAGRRGGRPAQPGLDLRLRGPRPRALRDDADRAARDEGRRRSSTHVRAATARRRARCARSPRCARASRASPRSSRWRACSSAA